MPSSHPLLNTLRLTLGALATPAQAAGNRLAGEKSPYLLQHAGNPVDWFPWDEEAFAEAARQSKLIFLSIGYSTCHWCHVMERESFEDAEVAAALKKDFIAIKVDREERPDIDNVYMRVCMALTGSGGWPLTIIMTPDRLPVFAGTYLPKARRYNHPGLLELLPRAAAAWQRDPEGLRDGGGDLMRKLQQPVGTETAEPFSAALFDEATRALRSSFDRLHGGFGAAPKFPRPHNLSYLLQRSLHGEQSELLEMVTWTLDKMRQGGIYDHLGFGFHRYSTDQQWLLPHFEKMLYDQAGLSRCYLEAFQLTGNPAYATTAREIFHYVERVLSNPQGGFYSAEDADSEGVEGRFYVWREQEIIDLLGAERGRRFCRIYQVRETGNFTPEVPGELAQQNILHRTESVASWAARLAVPSESLLAELEEDRQTLFRARDKRPHPFLDDKLLTAWNGMMISSFALGGRLFNDESYLRAAEAAADFILSRMRDGSGALLRRWREGEAAIGAFAEDYAFLALGLLELYRSTFSAGRLAQALELAEELQQGFSDSSGRLFDTRAETDLPLRSGDLYDGATPSATSAALNLFVRLFRLTGQPVWRQRAERLLAGAAAEVGRYPAGYTELLLGAGQLLEAGRELVVVGRRHAEDTRALLETVRTGYLPDLTVLLRPLDEPSTIDPLVSFVSAMEPLDGAATAYLCENFSCRRPVTDPQELESLLGVS